MPSMPSMPSMLPRAASALLLIVLITGCESLLPSFYSVPVRQGNYINQTMIGQLRPGMTRQQVQRIMGTPLVADPFHQNRWDYYYQYGKGGKITEQRHVILFFSGDTLNWVDGTADQTLLGARSPPTPVHLAYPRQRVSCAWPCDQPEEAGRFPLGLRRASWLIAC